MIERETHRANWLTAILTGSSIVIIVCILLILGVYLAVQLGVRLGETFQFLAVVDLAFGLRFLTPLLGLINIIIAAFLLPGSNKRMITFASIIAALGIIASLTWWIILFIIWTRG